VNAKEKYLKEIKNTITENTRMQKRDSLITEMEKVLMVWIEDQTNHNHPLKPKA
jgi:hypothetical protein